MPPLPIRYPDLGRRFTELMDRDREGGKWTITQLAATAGQNGEGVTFATIARLRKGQTRPRPALLRRLAELFGVTEEEIIGDDAPKSRKRLKTAKLSRETKAHADAPPRPNSLEWKLGRIQSLRKQIDAADNLKPELQRLCDEVQAEIQRVKEQSMQSP